MGLLGDGISLPLEFAVFSQGSVKLIAEIIGPQMPVWEAFKGLPEAWRSELQQGHFFRTDLRDKVRLVKRWLDQTLPGFYRDVLAQD